MEEKTYNSPTGILCPVCKKGIIKLSLHDFLANSSTKCPICGTDFRMDKRKCAGVINKLHDLDVATTEVNRLKHQSL